MMRLQHLKRRIQKNNLAFALLQKKKKKKKKGGVSASTLGRRLRGVQRSGTTKNYEQRKITSQQEIELCTYTEQLITQGLPPTRPMIRNFASAVTQERVSDAWVTRFVNRNQDSLIIK
jgi:hypothetical protein